MDFDILLGIADKSPTLVILAGAWWVVRMDVPSKLRDSARHIEECSKIPKAQIMDALEDLHNDVRDLARTQDVMAKEVNQLIGREAGRKEK